LKQDRIKIMRSEELDLQSFFELNFIFPGPEVGIARVKRERERQRGHLSCCSHRCYWQYHSILHFRIVPEPCIHRITESQNGRGCKGPLWVI